MGDISAEPSMEEILSSIKRIIAEEGEGTPQRARRPQPSPAPVDRPADTNAARSEILELREPMPLTPRAGLVDPAQPSPAPSPAAKQEAPASAPTPPRAVPADPIVSQQAAAASRGSLEALTRLVVKPEGPPAGDNTLEGLVREMLRPMLREWLDAKLPEIVEAMVAREIERISGNR